MLSCSVRSLIHGVLLSILMVPTLSVASEKVLRFGVLPYTSANRLVKVFSPIKRYLELKLNRKIELSTTTSYKTFLARTKSQYYDIALTPPHFALLLERYFGYKQLARVSGELYAVVIVQADSPYNNIRDLRGKVIATPDKMSMISLLGEKLFADNGLYWPGDIRFIAKSSQYSAGIATALGETDASIIFFPPFKKYMVSNEFQKELRVLAKTTSAPHAVFIAKSSFSKLSILKSALLRTRRDMTNGAAYLRSTGVEDIVDIDPNVSEFLERYVRLLIGYQPENRDD